MNINEPNILNEEDLRLLKAYLDDKEKLKAFLIAYMYIIGPGMADGITESQLLESESTIQFIKDHEDINEGLIGNIFNFIKGRNAISKYYKGLDSAAKNFISRAKQIDNMDQDKKSKARKDSLKNYEETVRSLNDIKSDIDDLKSESKILQKYDSYANYKYKIKLFLTGRKADVSLSKLKGYEDNIDKIKADQQALKQEIADAEKEAAEKEKAAKDKEAADKQKAQSDTTDTNDKTTDEKPVDSNKEEIKKQIKELTSNKNKLKIDSIKNPDKKDSLQKNIDELTSKIASLEKQLTENSILSLTFFYDIHNINEQIKCLENSIEENQ